MKKYQPDQPHEADPCRKPPAKYVPRSRPGRPGGRGFGRDDDDDDRRGFEGLPPAQEEEKKVDLDAEIQFDAADSELKVYCIPRPTEGPSRKDADLKVEFISQDHSSHFTNLEHITISES